MYQTNRECLIIDDDPDDQEIFEMCVHKVSATIDCRAMDNGADAIVMLLANSEYTPEYIFLDMNMPRMNGLECLRELKKIKRLENTKIFMYSTSSESWAVRASRELGAHDFIVKPVKTTELQDRLHSIFNIVPGIKP